MSCLKLSYNEKDECLEQLVIFYGGAYEKSATAVKFCTNYYPFGLQHSTSWTRISDLKNNFLYNAGAELNEQTQNYEMFYRHYDPALGRMNGIDPVAAKYSSLTPYNYSFNDPIAFNDPMGDDPNRERREFIGNNWEMQEGYFRDENPHHWHRGSAFHWPLLPQIVSLVFPVPALLPPAGPHVHTGSHSERSKGPHSF